MTSTHRYCYECFDIGEVAEDGINCLIMKCDRCNGLRWYVCKICVEAGRCKIIKQRSSYKQHHRRLHPATAMIPTTAEATSEDDCTNEYQHQSFTPTEDSLSTEENHATNPLFVSPATFTFQNMKSSRYFSHDFKSGDALSMLVSNSQFMRGLGSGGILDDVEVQFHLLATQLAFNITRNDRDKLAKLVRWLLIIMERRFQRKISNVATSNVIETAFPTTPAKIRNLYLEGARSICSNIPTPNVRIIGGHAYISIRECIADILAHGLPLDFIDFSCSSQTEQSVDINSKTTRAREIWDAAALVWGDLSCLVIYLSVWSDDFEPNSSIKSNRQSCWMMTITISPPEGMQHSLSYTYPIAIGKKDANHECIEKQFALELQSLRVNSPNNSFYSKRHGGNVNVYADLFVALQDQPERRSANYIMLGGGKYTAQWGIAADFASIASGIPACKACFLRHLEDSEQVSVCTNCLNWTTDGESSLLDISPPDDYPPCSVFLTENGKIRPIRITYETLRSAVVVTHHNIAEGTWSVDNGKSYLLVSGLNTEAINQVLLHAGNARLYNTLYESRESDLAKYQKICRVKSANPDLFQHWEFPSLWSRGVELSQHIDVVMHLLFLGVIKTSVKSVESWLKCRGKYDSFQKSMDSVFESVQSMNLGWCKALPYRGGTFGGWVSEIFLCIARLLPWVYSRLLHVAADPAIYTDPDEKPMSKWTKKENIAWLRHRRLAVSGSAKEVMERVHVEVNQADGPPPVVQINGGPVTHVLTMVKLLHIMTCNLMTKTIIREVTAVECERLIKLFLSAFDIFDASMRDGTTRNPKWLTSYNFLCLLNLPSCMRRFGPLSNLWEGGGQGEKILSIFKPLHNGFHKKWHKAIMTNALMQMSLDRVSDAYGKPQEQSSSSTKNEVVTLPDGISPSDIRRYKDINEAMHLFSKGKPISVVQIEPTGEFVILLKKPISSFVFVKCKEFSECRIGWNYFIWSLRLCTPISHQRTVVGRACLLLPLLLPTKPCFPVATSHTDCIKNVYCIIDSRWNTLQIDKSFSFPLV